MATPNPFDLIDIVSDEEDLDLLEDINPFDTISLATASEEDAPVRPDFSEEVEDIMDLPASKGSLRDTLQFYENGINEGYEEEGDTFKPYKFFDKAKNSWEIDIGFGRMLHKGIKTEEEADSILASLAGETAEESRANLDAHVYNSDKRLQANLHPEVYGDMPNGIKSAVLQLMYQNGNSAPLGGWPKLSEAIANKDWVAVSSAMEDSDWYRNNVGNNRGANVVAEATNFVPKANKEERVRKTIAENVDESIFNIPELTDTAHVDPTARLSGDALTKRNSTSYDTLHAAKKEEGVFDKVSRQSDIFVASYFQSSASNGMADFVQDIISDGGITKETTAKYLEEMQDIRKDLNRAQASPMHSLTTWVLGAEDAKDLGSRLSMLTVGEATQLSFDLAAMSGWSGAKVAGSGAIGGAIGFFVPVPGATAAGALGLSAAAEFDEEQAGSIMERLIEEFPSFGTKQFLNELTNNPENVAKLEAIVSKANIGAGVITAVDAIPLKKIANVVGIADLAGNVSKAWRRSKLLTGVGKTVTNIAVEAGTGVTGQALSYVANEEEIRAAEVFAEAAGVGAQQVSTAAPFAIAGAVRGRVKEARPGGGTRAESLGDTSNVSADTQVVATERQNEANRVARRTLEGEAYDIIEIDESGYVYSQDPDNPDVIVVHKYADPDVAVGLVDGGSDLFDSNVARSLSPVTEWHIDKVTGEVVGTQARSTSAIPAPTSVVKRAASIVAPIEEEVQGPTTPTDPAQADLFETRVEPTQQELDVTAEQPKGTEERIADLTRKTQENTKSKQQERDRASVVGSTMVSTIESTLDEVSSFTKKSHPAFMESLKKNIKAAITARPTVSPATIVSEELARTLEEQRIADTTGQAITQAISVELFSENNRAEYVTPHDEGALLAESEALGFPDVPVSTEKVEAAPTLALVPKTKAPIKAAPIGVQKSLKLPKPLPRDRVEAPKDFKTTDKAKLWAQPTRIAITKEHEERVKNINALNASNIEAFVTTSNTLDVKGKAELRKQYNAEAAKQRSDSVLIKKEQLADVSRAITETTARIKRDTDAVKAIRKEEKLAKKEAKATEKERLVLAKEASAREALAKEEHAKDLRVRIAQRSEHSASVRKAKFPKRRLTPGESVTPKKGSLIQSLAAALVPRKLRDYVEVNEEGDILVQGRTITDSPLRKGAKATINVGERLGIPLLRSRSVAPIMKVMSAINAGANRYIQGRTKDGIAATRHLDNSLKKALGKNYENISTETIELLNDYLRGKLSIDAFGESLSRAEDFSTEGKTTPNILRIQSAAVNVKNQVEMMGELVYTGSGGKVRAVITRNEGGYLNITYDLLERNKGKVASVLKRIHKADPEGFDTTVGLVQSYFNEYLTADMERLDNLSMGEKRLLIKSLGTVRMTAIDALDAQDRQMFDAEGVKITDDVPAYTFLDRDNTLRHVPTTRILTKREATDIILDAKLGDRGETILHTLLGGIDAAGTSVVSKKRTLEKTASQLQEEGFNPEFGEVLNSIQTLLGKQESPTNVPALTIAKLANGMMGGVVLDMVASLVPTGVVVVGRSNLPKGTDFVALTSGKSNKFDTSSVLIEGEHVPVSELFVPQELRDEFARIADPESAFKAEGKAMQVFRQATTSTKMAVTALNPATRGRDVLTVLPLTMARGDMFGTGSIEAVASSLALIMSSVTDRGLDVQGQHTSDILRQFLTENGILGNNARFTAFEELIRSNALRSRDQADLLSGGTAKKVGTAYVKVAMDIMRMADEAPRAFGFFTQLPKRMTQLGFGEIVTKLENGEQLSRVERENLSDVAEEVAGHVNQLYPTFDSTSKTGQYLSRSVLGAPFTAYMEQIYKTSIYNVADYFRLMAGVGRYSDISKTQLAPEMLRRTAGFAAYGAYTGGMVAGLPLVLSGRRGLGYEDLPEEDKDFTEHRVQLSDAKNIIDSSSPPWLRRTGLTPVAYDPDTGVITTINVVSVNPDGFVVAAVQAAISADPSTTSAERAANVVLNLAGSFLDLEPLAKAAMEVTVGKSIQGKNLEGRRIEHLLKAPLKPITGVADIFTTKEKDLKEAGVHPALWNLQGKRLIEITTESLLSSVPVNLRHSKLEPALDRLIEDSTSVTSNLKDTVLGSDTKRDLIVKQLTDEEAIKVVDAYMTDVTGALESLGAFRASLVGKSPHSLSEINSKFKDSKIHHYGMIGKDSVTVKRIGYDTYVKGVFADVRSDIKKGKAARTADNQAAIRSNLAKINRLIGTWEDIIGNE